MLIHRIIEFVERVEAGGQLTRDDGRELAAVPHVELPALFWGADRLRRRAFHAATTNCAICNAKCGACEEDCAYCAQSAHHVTGIQGYALLSKDELVAAAESAHAEGVPHYGFVTSGRALADAELDVLCAALAEIVHRGLPVGKCFSLGLLSEAQLARLKDAGMVRYHHNLETSRRHFPKTCTTHTWDDRVRTAEAVKRLGLELCCGALFGLGEDWEDRIDLALELRRIDADSVPLNFLSAIPGTPLAGTPPLPPLEILKTVSLYRFLLPDKELRVCGGREANLRELQPLVFMAGASGIMVGNYLVTSGRDLAKDRQLIADLELA